MLEMMLGDDDYSVSWEHVFDMTKISMCMTIEKGMINMYSVSPTHSCQLGNPTTNMLQLVEMLKTYQQPARECDEWRQEGRAPTGRRRSSQSDCGQCVCV